MELKDFVLLDKYVWTCERSVITCCELIVIPLSKTDFDLRDLQHVNRLIYIHFDDHEK